MLVPMRTRLRTLLLVVALLAVVSAAGALLLRKQRLARQAALHAQQEQVWRFIKTLSRRRLEGGTIYLYDNIGSSMRKSLAGMGTKKPSNAAPERYELRLVEARLDYHLRMKEKYQLAAAYFWLPVPPDPPEPQ